MPHRPHGRKPTVALWMLIALADFVLVASSGILPLLLLALAAAAVGGIVLIARRAHTRATVTQGVRSWQVARAQVGGRGRWEAQA